MREIKELLVSKINELIDNGTVDRVIGWKAGEFCYDVSPAIFTKENLDELVYNSFCGANQSNNGCAVPCTECTGTAAAKEDPCTA
mgnify:CR=1 FL=1